MTHPMRSAFVGAAAASILLTGCFSVHLRRLSDDDRVKRVLTLTGAPACVKAVVLQLHQGGVHEAHEVPVDDGKYAQVFAAPFAAGKPVVLDITAAQTASPCPTSLHARFRKELAGFAPGELAIDFKQVQPQPAARVPGGPILPGQPGGPELADGTLEAPPTLAPDPGVGSSLTVQLAAQKDAAPKAVEGQAHLIHDYPWHEAARGIYWLAAHPKTDPKKVRGADVVFFAETDCQRAAWYQYAQRKAVFSTGDARPQVMGTGFIGHNGRHDTAAGEAPEVDDALPYPEQVAGADPAMEAEPGIPIRNATTDPADVIDTYSGVLGGGRYKFKGAQRLKLEHRFWTYLICREPYLVMGHFEWGTDVAVSSVRDEVPFQPPGIQEPQPEPKWVPGP